MGRPPYIGPPTYETIARRFSSQSDQQIYFTRKRQEEAKERGEFVDIHDIARNPNDYDVLITDINYNILKTTIAEELGIPYLSVATECQAKEVVQKGNGYIHGLKYRAIVSFIVGYNGVARWVFFIANSVSPLTYLSTQVLDYTKKESSLLFGLG